MQWSSGTSNARLPTFDNVGAGANEQQQKEQPCADRIQDDSDPRQRHGLSMLRRVALDRDVHDQPSAPVRELVATERLRVDVEEVTYASKSANELFFWKIGV